MGNVRSTSLLMPRSPLWQFSKSNANPIVGLCETAFRNIDCHSQLGEWGKGLVFTSNLRLAQSAPKTQPGRIWSVSIISRQISQGWATYLNKKEEMFNNRSTDRPSVQTWFDYCVRHCKCYSEGNVTDLAALIQIHGENNATVWNYSKWKVNFSPSGISKA